MPRRKKVPKVAPKEPVVTAHPILKAWFTKKGGGGKVFSKSHKRWFVMDDHSITYYDRDNERKAKGNIFIQQIRQVKTNGRELLLVTGFRTYSMTSQAVDTTVLWADAIEARLKDTETVRKVVKKAEKLIRKSNDAEKHVADLAEYAKMLEQETATLVEENATLLEEVAALEARK